LPYGGCPCNFILCSSTCPNPDAHPNTYSNPNTNTYSAPNSGARQRDGEGLSGKNGGKTQYGGTLMLGLNSLIGIPDPVQNMPGTNIIGSLVYDPLQIPDWKEGPAGTGKLRFDMVSLYLPLILSGLIWLQAGNRPIARL